METEFNKWIKLNCGVEVFITNWGKCAGCNALIIWAETKNKKRIPINANLEASHFDTCPKAEKFRKKKLIKKVSETMRLF